MITLAQEKNPSGLDNLKTVVEIIGTSVTAVAVVVGAIWAYFKFVKGRTYRPRLSVGLSGQWLVIDGKPMLMARITVKNLGASVITLRQFGTGLRVSALAGEQPAPPTPATWDELRVFEVLREHEWIEPAETVSDDLLLDLGLPRPATTLFEARLVWGYSGRRTDIVVFARQVIPVDATVSGKSTA